jgi:alpha-L-fucosidase
MKPLTLLSAFLFFSVTSLRASDRMDWWHEARFGMFIHWGLYSVAGGEWEGKRGELIASWLQHEMKIPPDEYAKLTAGFTAEKFKPEEWAALAKKAGMKYAVFTSKHHEGFSLFDSKLSDFDVMNTPAKRDVTKEYLDAFRKEGIRAGLYFSIIDWHHPEFPVAGDHLHPMRDDAAYKAQPRDLAKYVDFMHGQVKELVTGYGPLDVMWWDFGYGWLQGDSIRAKELEAMVREHQPGIVMNNRLYENPDNPHGDFATPEQHIPPNGMPGLDWETCMTINDTWGYKPHDLHFKSSTVLIRNLVDIVSKGGNYLLNVGPRPDGTIPEALVERLEDIGKWMDVNGDAIHGTNASPYATPVPWGRITRKEVGPVTRLYLHIFDWPESREIVVPALGNRILSCKRMAGGGAVDFKPEDDGIHLRLSRGPDHEAATVLVMEIEGAPRPAGIRPDASGTYRLTAARAERHGATLIYPSDEGREDSIGSWTNPEEWVSWSFDVPKDGQYDVEISYGCDATGGGSYTVEVGGQKLTAKSQHTGGWFQRVTESPGSVELKAGDSVQLSVRIHDMTGVAVMDLQKIELKPARR